MPVPMSKLARAVALAALVAAMHLAGLVAVAQAHTTYDDPASVRHAALGRVGFLATGDHAVASQEQPTADAQQLFRRGERASLAQEHYSSTREYGNPTIQRALAQERYYGTWGYGGTSAPTADEPSGQPGWPTPALGVLAAVLALVAGVAVVAARRVHRSQRASQTA